MTIFRSGYVKKQLYIVAGSLALLVGLIGIVLPVLPSTPFLLLAAICYMRGSSRLYNTLLSNRFIGRYIDDYLNGKRMSARTKAFTLLFLWVTLTATAVLATDNTIIRIFLIIVLAGVTIHILMLKSSRKREKTAA